MSTNTSQETLIRCLAVDDEPLALAQLSMMIEKTPYMTLVASCNDAFEAMKYINNCEVDAMFIDINMPDLNGMEFVSSLTNPPLVVFTTAYPQYALDAYKVSAIDYLLKPYGMQDFQKAADKIRRQFLLLQSAAKQEDTPSINDEEDVLYLKVDYRVMRVEIQTIRYIESMREYLRIYLVTGEKFMTLMPISKMTALLEKHNFIRIHRSYLVNMKKVVEVSKLEVRMDDKKVLPIGDSFKEELKKYIADRVLQ